MLPVDWVGKCSLQAPFGGTSRRRPYRYAFTAQFCCPWGRVVYRGKATFHRRRSGIEPRQARALSSTNGPRYLSSPSGETEAGTGDLTQSSRASQVCLWTDQLGTLHAILAAIATPRNCLLSGPRFQRSLSTGCFVPMGATHRPDSLSRRRFRPVSSPLHVHNPRAGGVKPRQPRLSAPLTATPR